MAKQKITSEKGSDTLNQEDSGSEVLQLLFHMYDGHIEDRRILDEIRSKRSNPSGFFIETCRECCHLGGTKLKPAISSIKSTTFVKSCIREK